MTAIDITATSAAMSSARRRVLIVLGTRPEAIKLAPVIHALMADRNAFETRVVTTGQHRDMAQRALGSFGLAADVKLETMSSATSLARLTAALCEQLDGVYEEATPDWVIVQGDTTSAMTGALVAFYRKIKVAHVEAGLRTGDRFSPFPEEVNRTIITRVADLHFAPTSQAADNLRREGVPDSAIRMTGNTVVDALLWISERVEAQRPPEIGADVAEFIAGRRMVLVTSHRRESFGEGLRQICQGLLDTVERLPNAVIVYPVHPNPSVKKPVHRMLGAHPRIKLLDPVSYVALVWLMRQSYCIFTDSGGIQEEAPTVGKPVLVLRDTTERPEVLEAGCARLVGANAKMIAEHARQLFEDPIVYTAMANVKNPFGDGRAAERIRDALKHFGVSACRAH